MIKSSRSEQQIIDDYFKSGTIHLHFERKTEAIKDLDEALRLKKAANLSQHDTQTADIYQNIALYHEKQNNLDQAYDYYEKANKIREKINKTHPDMVEAYIQMGDIKKRQGNKSAKEDFEKARTIFKVNQITSDPELLERITRLERDIYEEPMGDTDETSPRKSNKHSLTRHKEEPKPLNHEPPLVDNQSVKDLIQEGISQMRDKNLDEAIKTFKEIKKTRKPMEPNELKDVNEQLQVCYETKGELDNEKQVLEELIQQTVNDKESKVRYESKLAHSYLKRGKLALALGYFLEINEFYEKKDAETLKNVGLVYFKYGDYPKAEEFLIEAENQSRTQEELKKEIYFNLGLVYEKLGKFEKSQSNFSKYKGAQKNVDLETRVLKSPKSDQQAIEQTPRTSRRAADSPFRSPKYSVKQQPAIYDDWSKDGIRRWLDNENANDKIKDWFAQYELESAEKIKRLINDKTYLNRKLSLASDLELSPSDQDKIKKMLHKLDQQRQSS